jgi:hypothetical protein
MVIDTDDVLFPIEFFIDKSHVSEKGHLHLEPVMFTFTLFSEATKNLSSVWRLLGYVNDLDAMSSAQKSRQVLGESVRDYHSIMDVILSSFVEEQHMGCFPYEFPFGGAGKLNLKFPVSYVIGDIKGLSTLCGMYSNSNCNRIHRACNCSFEASDNPDVKCTRLEWHEIHNLVDNRDKERLQALSQHMVDNAFYKVQFCDDMYGIHGCTPVGSLHALQLGLFQYYLEGLMLVFHYKKKKICALDDLAKVISSCCAHQSD